MQSQFFFLLFRLPGVFHTSSTCLRPTIQDTDEFYSYKNDHKIMALLLVRHSYQNHSHNPWLHFEEDLKLKASFRRKQPSFHHSDFLYFQTRRGRETATLLLSVNYRWDWGAWVSEYRRGWGGPARACRSPAPRGSGYPAHPGQACNIRHTHQL